MSAATVVIAAFVVALMAFGVAWGAPIIAVPIVLVGALAFGVFDLRRRRSQARQMREFRDEAKAEKVDFTDRDQETLVSE